MRSEKLGAILDGLNSSSGDIEASAVLSTDGIIMDSRLPAGMDKDRLSAMSAAIIALGSRASEDLGRGSLDQVLIKGKSGYVLVTYAGLDVVVTVLTKPEARLGLIFLDVKRAADAIKKLFNS